MTKRYCDKCGKELCADEDFNIQGWWTLVRHGNLEITLELCDQCFEKQVKGADCDGCQHYADEYTADACYECSRSYADCYEPRTERSE